MPSSISNYDDVQKFRTSPEAISFAKSWIEAQAAGDVSSDYHLNLLAWTANDPGHVLGIVLNLIEEADSRDELIQEAVGLGPVDWLMMHRPASFADIIRQAVEQHAGFALYTKWRRENEPR